MSADRTGYALGKLNPILYYRNSKGHCILAPSTELARWAYETPNQAGESLRSLGYEICEADTLAEVDRLQNRLVAQEMSKLRSTADREDRVRQEAWQQVGDNLRQRMVSSSCSPYEREFIELYLKLREEKRAKHRQRWLESSMYLWAREQDSSKSLVEGMKSEPGDRWER